MSVWQYVSIANLVHAVPGVAAACTVDDDGHASPSGDASLLASRPPTSTGTAAGEQLSGWQLTAASTTWALQAQQTTCTCSIVSRFLSQSKCLLTSCRQCFTCYG